MPRKKTKRKSKPKPLKLEPWVVEMSNATVGKGATGSKKRFFSGYITAFILSFLGVFHRKFGEFPTTQQIRDVFAYSQDNKPRAQLRRLEDEGYIRLDATRCHVVEILKAPYVTPRPDFFNEVLNGYYRRFGISPTSSEGDGRNA